MGALIALVEQERVSAWVVLVIVAREFAVTGLRLVAAGDSRIIGASQLGKLKAFSQNVMVVCLLLAPRDAGWTDIVVADRARAHRVVVRRLLLARPPPLPRAGGAAVTEVVLIAAAYLAGSLPVRLLARAHLPRTPTSARSARRTPARRTSGATSAGASAWRRCCWTSPRARCRRSRRCTGRAR